MTTAKTFNLLCWEGYDHPELLRQFAKNAKASLSVHTIVSDHAASQRVLDQPEQVDVLNINNPYPRKVLYPANKLLTLDPGKLNDRALSTKPWLQPLLDWSYADDKSLIGICQRFGSFNLVINSRKVSREIATKSGFQFPEVTHYQEPYGVLLFPEFNIFHICIAAGLNPFGTLTLEQLDRFSLQAQSWFRHASLVTEDATVLNRALVAGDISFYLSGGVFVAGAARLEGHHQIECVTPVAGPINGKGAIAFVEVNSVVKNLRNMRRLDTAYQFLNQILEPETIVHIASNPKVCNPVVQMQNKDVFNRLSKNYLHAIQWDSLEEDIERCVIYNIPPMFTELFGRLTRAMEKECAHRRAH